MTTTKSYDNLNRLKSVGSALSPGLVVNSGYTYNSANQRTGVTNADGSYWVYTYDALGQVQRGAKYFADNTIVPGQQFDYTFDDIGNRKTAKTGGDQIGQNQRTNEYTLKANGLNQYDNRTVPGYAGVLGVAAAGASVTVNSASPWRKGEYFRQELTIGNSSAVWQGVTVSDGATTTTGNLFLPATPENDTYDLDGNLTQDGRWDYVWDAENRLTRMTSRSGAPSGSVKRLEFVYDHQGRRIGKKVWNNTAAYGAPILNQKFVYDGWNLVAVLSSSSSLLSSFTWGLDLSGSIQGAGGVGGLLAVTDATPGTHFCAYDGNGNVRALVNAASGTVSAGYEYGPFGELIRKSGLMATANPFRFSTKYQDDESDQLYYGYRSYNPSTGRWPNRDPLGEPEFFKRYARGKSLDQIFELAKKGLQAGYQFAGNNPITQIDILGLENVQIVVTSVIRPPDTQAGVKTIHSVVVNEYGQIVSRNTFTGTTSIGGIAYPTGTSTFRDWVTGTHPNFTVTMIGNSSSAALPSFFDIDYNYDIQLNFCMRTGTLSGKNDGYPSYTVRVKGKTVWDWQQPFSLWASVRRAGRSSEWGDSG